MIQPNWPAPKNVHAYTTSRQGGFSLPPYDSFNLSSNTDDDPEHVLKNRRLLTRTLQLPTEPCWLNQTHSNIIIDASSNQDTYPTADASYSRKPHTVCCILTADCLPILVCNEAGNTVAAIHAGWRGLASGILEASLDKLRLDPNHLLVWLGPAIGNTAFEVGIDVYHAFVNQDSHAKAGFQQIDNEKWLADIRYLARLRLHNYQIKHIYGGDYCTLTQADTFYSYRRDGKDTGRMASLIWFSE